MKWCLYARRCPYGNIYEKDYCGIESDNCEMDNEKWEMLDLNADISTEDYIKECGNGYNK